MWPMTFYFEGKCYEVADYDEYKQSQAFRLPDGRVFHVTDWAQAEGPVPEAIAFEEVAPCGPFPPVIATELTGN